MRMPKLNRDKPTANRANRCNDENKEKAFHIYFSFAGEVGVDTPIISNA